MLGWARASAFLLLTASLVGAGPAVAQEAAEEASPAPAEVRVRQVFTRVRSDGRFEGAAPGFEVQVSVPLSRLFRVEAEFLRGEGTMRSCTHIHHQDLDLGVSWRLDNPGIPGDGPLQRVFLLGQWNMSEARTAFAEGDVRTERDEGGGIGFVRLAHPQKPVSYSYRVVVHPTFANSHGNNILGQRALFAQGAVQFRLGEDGALEAGYTYRTHKLASTDGARAIEQGPFFGGTLRF